MRRPRKGNPVRFRADRSVSKGSVSGLRFTVHCVDRPLAVDLTPYRQRWLALLLAGELRARAVGWQVSTGRRYLRVCHRFLEFIDRLAGEIREPRSLRAAHIDDFERQAHASCGALSARLRVQGVTMLLLGVAEERPSIFNTDLIERVSYVSARRLPPKSKPRDSYSPYVRKQIRAAAKEDAWAAIRRLERSDKASWLNASPSKIEAIDQSFAGSGTIPHILYKNFRYAGGERPAIAVYGEYAFTAKDIAAMIVLVCLETGLEPECCVGLDVNAIVKTGENVARIQYSKNRRAIGVSQSIPVDDRGEFSVPALIRRVVELGSSLRRHHGSAALWLHVGGRGVREPRYSCDVRLSVLEWAQRRGIVDDDGRPLRLLLSRLRKTHRSARYKQLDGDLVRFAVNHSREVAGRHYAEIESHKDLHAGVVAEAQTEVVEGVRRSGAAIRVEAEAPVGMEELWLASCSDVNKPPSGPPNRRCQIPYWGCLDCENAVYSAGKLPALIDFRNKLVDARLTMNAGDWQAKFGHAHNRLVEGILPRFSVEAIRLAENMSAFAYAPYETFR